MQENDMTDKRKISDQVLLLNRGELALCTDPSLLEDPLPRSDCEFVTEIEGDPALCTAPALEVL